MLRTLLLLLPLTAPTVLRAQTPADSSRYLELGRRYTRWAYGGLADSLHPRLNPQLGAAVGQGAFAGFLAQLVGRAGKEVAVVSESVALAGDSVVYTRQATYDQSDEVRTFVWTLELDGVIRRFGFR